MTLSTFTMLLDHPQPSSLFPKCYHHPKQKLYPLNNNSPFPSPAQGIPLRMSTYIEVKSLSRVQLFATPWAVAYQAPLSMGFSRQ